MDPRKAALDLLEQLAIPYTLEEHPAVYTIEELMKLGIDPNGEICKNLFLRDAKGRTHFLVVIPGNSKADLSRVAQQLDSTRLSFGSDQRLKKYLDLEPGSVSPLAVVNDEEHEVIVVFDRSLRGQPRVGVHPNDNTATVWLSFTDLERYIRHVGNEIRYIAP